MMSFPTQRRTTGLNALKKRQRIFPMKRPGLALKISRKNRGIELHPLKESFREIRSWSVMDLSPRRRKVFFAIY
jgi:hypothetical protein